MAKRVILLFLCLGFIILAFADVSAFIDGGRRGVLLFGTAVLPVLLPFFFVTGLMIQGGFASMFRHPSLLVASVGVLSGYPTTAKMLSELYDQGKITRGQAIRISTYTSMPSPIFVVATVGTGLYMNTALGVAMFLSLLIGMFLNGLLYGKVSFAEAHTQDAMFPRTDGVCDKDIHNYDKSSHTPPLTGHPSTSCRLMDNYSNVATTTGGSLRGELCNKHISTDTQLRALKIKPEDHLKIDEKPIAEIISSSLFSAVQAVLAVGAMIVVFFVLINQIGAVLNLGQISQLILASTLEMTNGVFLAGSFPWVAVSILAFGGICVALQGMIFFKSFRMPIWFYFVYKTTQTFISVGVFVIISMVVLP